MRRRAFLRWRRVSHQLSSCHRQSACFVRSSQLMRKIIFSVQMRQLSLGISWEQWSNGFSSGSGACIISGSCEDSRHWIDHFQWSCRDYRCFHWIIWIWQLLNHGRRTLNSIYCLNLKDFWFRSHSDESAHRCLHSSCQLGYTSIRYIPIRCSSSPGNDRSLLRGWCDTRKLFLP